MSATSTHTYDPDYRSKMDNIEVFMALCKGYCSINILVLPKQFDNGGWVTGVVTIFVCTILVLICALKLVQCGSHVMIYNYPDIADYAWGRKLHIAVKIILALCQFSFTVAQISFSIQALESTFVADNKVVSRWWFALGIIALYTPLAWARKLSYFSMGYAIGMIMILYTAGLIASISIFDLASKGPENDGFRPFNATGSWDMIGFGFYAFEGIGVVMPVMREAKNPRQLPKILTKAIITLSIFFLSFGLICYRYFGSQDESIVIYEMDSNSTLIKITKILFCINLIFSYPITIFPTN